MKTTIRKADGSYRITSLLYDAAPDDIVLIEYPDHQEIIVFNLKDGPSPCFYKLKGWMDDPEREKLYELHEYTDLTFLCNETTTSEVVVVSNIDDILERYRKGDQDGVDQQE